MKKTKYISFIAAMVTVCFSCSKQKTFGHVTYEGTLYDTIGGHPVEGVNITLEACNPFDGRNECAVFTVGTSVTDANGHFKIHEKKARSGRYYIYTNGHYHEVNADDLKDPKNTILYEKHP